MGVNKHSRYKKKNITILTYQLKEFHSAKRFIVSLSKVSAFLIKIYNLIALAVFYTEKTSGVGLCKFLKQDFLCSLSNCAISLWHLVNSYKSSPPQQSHWDCLHFFLSTVNACVTEGGPRCGRDTCGWPFSPCLTLSFEHPPLLPRALV